jgi:hypothetical protein
MVLAMTMAAAFTVTRPAHAIPPFLQEFQAKYVNSQSDDPNVKTLSQAALSNETGKCLVCHVPDQAKTERNAYGAALALLLNKDDFTRARLDTEPEKAKQEIVAALDKVAAQKRNPDQADSSTFGQLIAQGLLPGIEPPQAPAAESAETTDQPADAESGESQPAEAQAEGAGTAQAEPLGEAEPSDANRLAELLVSQIKAELKQQLIAELEPQLRQQVRAELYGQLKVELKEQLKESVKAVVLAELSAPGQVPSEVEAEAIEQIRQLGGTVLQLAESDDSRTVAFHLGGTDLTDEGLVHLKSLNKLVHLNLKGTQVTDAGMAHLAGLVSLTRLNLAQTSVGDEGLRHLMGLDNIVYLNLYGSRVTDAGLRYLAGMTNLRKLFLWQSDVTEQGARKLQAELPDCEVNW